MFGVKENTKIIKIYQDCLAPNISPMNYLHLSIATAGFVGGFIFSYITTLIKLIFYDYLQWQYSLPILSLLVISGATSYGKAKQQITQLLNPSIGNGIGPAQIINLILAMVPKPQTENALFKIETFTKYASIIYSRNGAPQIINIPYDPSLRRPGNRFRVNLISENKTEDITHQPGIPYFCTADELGGTKYTITDKFDDNVIHEYDKDSIPDMKFLRKYLDE